MSCELYGRYHDAYVDGELDPGASIELERHLAACASCQQSVAFLRTLKTHVRQAQLEVRAPSALRDRIRVALDEIDAAKEAPARPLIRIAPVRARHALPIAAAAAVLLGVTWWGKGSEAPPAALPQQASVSGVPIFEDVVRVHAADLPADVRGEEPQAVTRWFRDKLSFPVRPARFERSDARLLGARLSNVRDRRAAALYYDVGGSKVTVVVFDEPSGPPSALRRARLLGREVHYEQVGGYVVPVRARAGITYAFTGDLDRQALLRLAATARVSQ